jgi:hypothetical protein
VSSFFLFVQFEFTHALGPHAGRYIIDSSAAEDASSDAERAPSPIEARNKAVAGVTRGLGVADVLVVGVTPAPASMPRLRRRARYVQSGTSPAEVPLSIATFVKATSPLQDAREAERRLDSLKRSQQDQHDLVQEGLGVLNQAIRAYRAGARDPYAIEVTRRDARRVRIGFGSTEVVQEGRWDAALDIPSPPGRRRGRTQRLRPSEAVATALAGRVELLEAEDVLLRALIDLDNRRTRAAAFQVSAALRLLPAEIDASAAPPLAGARSLASDARRAAELEEIAAGRPLDDPEVRELEGIIDAVDELLDRRRYSGAERDI